MARKLTKHHPLFQKTEKAEVFLRELGLTLEWDGYHLNISDGETIAQLKDIESGDNISEFPCFYQTKLTIE